MYDTLLYNDILVRLLPHVQLFCNKYMCTILLNMTRSIQSLPS